MSTKQSNFLECDPTILEESVKFVKNDFEENFEKLMGIKESQLNSSSTAESKIVKPSPGVCVKCFKLNSNEKFFINLCQTDGIPPPEDINEEELTEILNSEEPSSFRIPMSISEPRIVKDKSGNSVDACDVAINPRFFMKCDNQQLFRDFLIAIIFEALSEKYNIQLNTENWIILKNRKFMGSLITHRIQNRDVKTVYESYKNPETLEKNKDLLKNMNENKKNANKNLIEVIDSEELESLKRRNNETKLQKIENSILNANFCIPEHRIHGKTNKESGNLSEIHIELFLPKCINATEFTVDINEDHILVQSLKRGLIFDRYFKYPMDKIRASADFHLDTRMLYISVPIKGEHKLKKT